MTKKPIVKLPPYEVEEVFASLSQTVDWGVVNYGIPDAWKYSRGQGIVIYVLDTGCTDHPDVQGNAICGGNFIDGETAEDAKSGHATHVIGTICAKDDHQGMVGVAPEATVVSLKVLSNSGSGGVESITGGLELCVAAKKKQSKLPPPDIVSMSLGSASDLGPFVRFQIKQLYKLNVPIVCAAGNTGRRGINYPAAYPETISVGAHDKEGRIADFSTYGKQMDFAAPGVEIYSTYLNGRYARLSGTSMATPIVSGIIALMLAKHRKDGGKTDCETVPQIREHLQKYAIDKGPKGWDDKWGYGIIDVPTLISGEGEVPEWKPPPRRGLLNRFFHWIFG